MFQTKKSLGQNFLKNEAILKKIADTLEINDSDTVVEIGPGEGTLTKYLLSSPAKQIIAIEKDRRLIERLKNKFPDERFTLIEGDALEIIPTLNIREYKLIGNIPYYITGYLFRIISELKDKPALSTFVVQKEVAERAIMKEPKSNLFSLSLQLWSDPKMIDIIKKENFSPIPKVDSAVLRLETKDNIPDIKNFYDTLHILFKQPRKTILNNLSEKIERSEAEKKLTDLNLPLTLRPQNLSLSDVVKISKLIS